MKRSFYTLVGIIVGLLLAQPFQVLSDSLIGKQVDMLAPVKIDGEYLNTDAIGIKGTTYAPVRAIAETLGKDVDWVNGEVVIVTPKESDTVSDAPGQSNISDRIAMLEDSIKSARGSIETYRTVMEFNDSVGAPEEANQEIEEAISRMEEQIAEYERIIAELQAQLTE